MRRPILFLCAVAGALSLAACVFAAAADNEVVARTKAGDASAAKLVVQKKDVPAGWDVSAAKPNFSGNLGCSDYKPKQSDLVVIGAAAHQLRGDGLSMYSQVQILKTVKMVKLDWQRTVVDPRVVPCIRKSMEASAKVSSFGPVTFPKLAPYTAAFRAILTFKSPAHSKPTEIDIVDLGAGANEVGFEILGPASDKSSIRSLEMRLARKLAARLHG